jgi:hypothetical protein
LLEILGVKKKRGGKTVKRNKEGEEITHLKEVEKGEKEHQPAR